MVVGKQTEETEENDAIRFQVRKTCYPTCSFSSIIGRKMELKDGGFACFHRYPCLVGKEKQPRKITMDPTNKYIIVSRSRYDHHSKLSSGFASNRTKFQSQVI